MKTSRLFTTMVILGALSGCMDHEDAIMPNDDYNSGGGVVVAQERDKSHPLTDYKSLIGKSETRTTETPALSDYIGRSYKLDDYPYESSRNVGLPVIDMAKYKSEKPDSYYSIAIRENDMSYYAFSDFSRYEQKSEVRTKVSTGASVKFFIFKIGAEHTYESVFKDTSSQTLQDIFGTVTFKSYDTKYEMIAPISLRKELANNYLKKSFIDQLYYTTPDEVINNYGGFILAKFISGGHATVLYTGKHEENSSTSEHQIETNFETEIGVSVKVVEASASGGVEVTVSGSESTTEKFTDIRFSLKTIGGSPTYAQFTTPQDLSSVSFNLTEWCSSLSNPNNLAIAELPDGALMPISDFVEEENLKTIINSYYQKGKKAQTPSIIEPYIDIHRGHRTPINEVWLTELVTRYGDRILLRSASMSLTAATKYTTQELSRIKLIFPGLRIVTESRQTPRITGPVDIPIIADNNDFDTSKMTKYPDPKSGKTYLLTSAMKNGKKIAYTLYDQNVINDYIFTGLVNRLRVDRTVSLATIQSQYYLIAL